MNYAHQGDVTFHPYKKKIVGEKTQHNGSLTLAWGEATGHNHVVTVPDITDMDAIRLPDGGWLLTLRAPGTIRHQEHHPITLAPGKYRVGGEREKDWFALSTRRVVD